MSSRIVSFKSTMTVAFTPRYETDAEGGTVTLFLKQFNDTVIEYEPFFMFDEFSSTVWLAERPAPIELSIEAYRHYLNYLTRFIQLVEDDFDIGIVERSFNWEYKIRQNANVIELTGFIQLAPAQKLNFTYTFNKSQDKIIKSTRIEFTLGWWDFKILLQVLHLLEQAIVTYKTFNP